MTNSGKESEKEKEKERIDLERNTENPLENEEEETKLPEKIDWETDGEKEIKLNPTIRQMLAMDNQYKRIFDTVTHPTEIARKMYNDNQAQIKEIIRQQTQVKIDFTEPFRRAFEMDKQVYNALKSVEFPNVGTFVPEAVIKPMELALSETIRQAFQPNQGILNALKTIELSASDIVSNLYFSETFLKIGEEARETVSTSKRLRGYKESPFFWANVKKVSRELISIPENHSDELLDYLSQETIDLEHVKELIGKFDVMELESELEDEEHNDYRFKSYLNENLKLHTAHPEHYRVYIPALFSIIEGTLGDIFNISKKGTAVEIKRKISIFFDLIDHVYTNESFELKFTFSNQLFLQNVKELFMELTKSSINEGEVKMNRNRALHGKDNPEDWTYDDFLSLAHLMKHILSIRRTAVILSEDFVTLIKEEEIQGKPIHLMEYSAYLSVAHSGNMPKKPKKQEELFDKIKREIQSDLKALFSRNPSVVTIIMDNGNFQDMFDKLGKLA